MNERVIIGIDKDQEWGYDESKPSTKFFTDFAELWDQNLDDYASIATITIEDKFGFMIVKLDGILVLIIWTTVNYQRACLKIFLNRFLLERCFQDSIKS